jgi:hypothetical protein
MMTCRKTGCGGTPTVLLPSQQDTRAIAVDATNVYWVTLGSGGLTGTTGTVMECAIAGCGGTPTPLASDPHLRCFWLRERARERDRGLGGRSRRAEGRAREADVSRGRSRARR